MVKLSVIGTRDFDDYNLLTTELLKEDIDLLVLGGKSGPDQLAQEFALDRDIPTQIYLPEYRKYGRSANYQRNLQMIDHSNRILIFWNHRSKSLFNYLPYIKERKKSFRTIMY